MLVRVIYLILIVALTLNIFSCRPEKAGRAEDADAELSESEQKEAADLFEDFISCIYHTTGMESSGLKREILKKAILGFFNMKKKNMLTEEKNIVTIFDISRSSTENRLFVIDLDKQEVLFQTLAAHGAKSGEEYAEKFSDIYGSHQSSIGFYVTGETYIGKHGPSLRLDGVDTGYNAKARERAIVLHGADYVSEEFVKKRGRLGRSQGCPAVPQELCEAIVGEVAEKTCFFIFYPDEEYEERCIYLNENEAIEGFMENTISCRV